MLVLATDARAGDESGGRLCWWRAGNRRLRWRRERWTLVLMATREVDARAGDKVGRLRWQRGWRFTLATRAVDDCAGGNKRGGRLCWWRQERQTLVLATRSVVLGEAWAGCRSSITELHSSMKKRN